MFGIDILVPVYNEGANILPLLTSLIEHVRTPFRVLICYDRDDDDTLTVLRGASLPVEIRYVRNQGRGVAGAVLTGFTASDAAAAIVMPADDHDNARILDHMVALFHEGADVVCPSRFMPGGSMRGCPLVKAAIVRTSALVLRHLARLPTHDPSNGFRLFSARTLRTIRIESTSGFTFSIELLVKTHRLGWRVAELPAAWSERRAGKSRFSLKWLSAYFVWFRYAFATAWLRKGPHTVALRPGGASDVTGDRPATP